MKTVRFTKVVEKAGTPAVHVSWISPARDRPLQSAVREHRVMSVHHEVKGTAKDFGTVGFIKGRDSQILIFPKSLRSFADRRVIGIDYDLLAEGKLERLGKSGDRTVTSAGSPAESRPPPSDENAARPSTEKKAREPRSEEVDGDGKPTRGERRTKNPPSTEKERRRPANETRRANRGAAGRAAGSLKIPSAVLKELRRVARELKAGKAVAAYERLSAVLDSAPARPDR